MGKNEKPKPISEHGELTHEKLTEGLRSRIRFARTPVEAIADWVTAAFGTVPFLAVNVVFFAGWIVWNMPQWGLPVFDPYPYELLTTIVSLEAIVLAIIVLISQNRQAKVTDIRQKINFEIDVRAEEEVTELLRLVSELHKSAGLKQRDTKALRWMKQKTDIDMIRTDVEKE